MNFKKCSTYAVAFMVFSLPILSCESDDNSDQDQTLDGSLTLSSKEIDFGEFQSMPQAVATIKNQTEDREVVLTLTNNTSEAIPGLSSSINFPGNAAVNFSFSRLDPGESIDVTFSFGPSNLGPGVYTGEATLTAVSLDENNQPIEGESVTVALRATVI